MGEWRLRFSLFDTIRYVSVVIPRQEIDSFDQSRDSDEIVFLRSIDSEPFRGKGKIQCYRFPFLTVYSYGAEGFHGHGGIHIDHETVRGPGREASCEKAQPVSVSDASKSPVNVHVPDVHRTGKRAYNSNNSPPVISPTLSPTHPHPGMMGGPVQSRQGYRSDLVHSNTPKRLRMSSEYDNSQYGMPNLNASGNMYPYSSMSLPSRAWSNGQQSRGHISYAPQATSNLPSTTFAAMPALSSGSVWPSHHSSTSFPSPPPSSNHSQYPSFQYPNSSGYPSNAGMLGPLSPRQLNTPAGYYDSYTTHQAHHGHQDSSTSSSAIRDLFPDQTTASDGAGLASPQSQGYNQPYLPGSGHYGSGVNDGTFPPAFGDGVDGQHRYQ